MTIAVLTSATEFNSPFPELPEVDEAARCVVTFRDLSGLGRKDSHVRGIGRLFSPTAF
jgi:hypothetical protein